MPDYEFRFFRNKAFSAVHVTTVADDALACERARLYLSQNRQFDCVEVRSGFRFMQKIDQAGLAGWLG